jgi:Trypsin-like peptidase domain
VFAILFLALAPGQFIESKDFAPEKQRAALEATAGIFQPTTRVEGTAVIVKQKDGALILLTAAHNVPVNGGDQVTLELFTAKSYPNVHVKIEEAFVKERMINEDLAVVVAPLKEPAAGLPICPKAKLPTPERFPFNVLTVGCDDAFGKPKLLTDRVLGKRPVPKRDGSRAMFWEAEHAQARGRSGGPLIDARGYVMGICSGIDVEKGKGYYTYITDIHKALDRTGFRWVYEESSAGSASQPGSDPRKVEK